jgi:acetoin utilization deacetylase AcuC-like enzyme
VRLIYTENMHSLMLPAGHPFPVGKYDRIFHALRDTHAEALQLGPMASWDDVRLVHDIDYVRDVRDGSLPVTAVRRMGFPWSEALMTRSLRSVGGTLAALAWAMGTGAAGHIAGGTHHAHREFGAGYCVWNDLAVAVVTARRDHRISRVAVIDLDVHQGDGTASIFRGDDDTFTLSLHGAKNFPFRKAEGTLDIALPDGCEDDAYLEALDPALERVAAFHPELLLYQAGVDGLAGDRLGRLALSGRGLKARDERVFRLARRLGVPIVVTLGGGYHRDMAQSIAAHVQVYRGPAVQATRVR